jgi:ABC-2 type transport system ATP-binding protein
MMETAPAILRTEKLTKRFRFTPVLNQLDLVVPKGSIYALVGPNGAGKTTCIKILMNLLQSSVGRAEVLGRDSRHLSPADFTQLGYASENLQLPGWMTLEYFLGYLKPFYPSWDDSHAAELLRQFELPKDRKLKDLSRGMQMKAALASVLAYHPRVIVLDEPFSGLDPLVRDELIQTLLAHCSDATVLISSHDLAEMETFASHIGYLEYGSLRFSEEITSLQDRFREVDVVLNQTILSQPAAIPRVWPTDWLAPETSGALVRFTDAQFQTEKTTAQIHALWSNVASIHVRAIPLRSIFVALAKRGRKAE